MKKARRPVTILVMTFSCLSCNLLPMPTPAVLVQTVEVIRLVPVTSTPAPTATSALLPPPVFEEDFEAGGGEWYLGPGSAGSARVADGRLLVTVRWANYLYFTGHPGLDYLNTPFDLTVSLASDTQPRDAYAAVGFRCVDDANYAEVAVNRDGFVSMGLTLDDTYYPIILWTRPAPAIRQPYMLRLMDSRSRVKAFLNDNLVFDIPLQDPPLGGIFLFAGTYDEVPSTWAFDDLQIRPYLP